MRSGSEIRIPTTTTNKPEVVAWRWRKPVVNDHGETVGFTAWELSDTPGFLPWWTNDPLIRLSDYEALQAECEKPAPDVVGLMEVLVEALARCRHQASYTIGGIEALQNQLNKTRDIAHETITAYRNEVGYEMVANRKLRNADMHRDSGSRAI